MKVLLFFYLSLCLTLTGCFGPAPQQTRAPQKPTSKPYVIKGKRYIPQTYYELEQEGIASYYGGKDGCHGTKTATGECFNMYALTAAHRTLPLYSVVRVTNMENGRSIVLKVNDRGPFKKGRIIDVSAKAAQLLGFHKKGLAKVRICTLVKQSVALEKTLKERKKYQGKSTLRTRKITAVQFSGYRKALGLDET